MTVNEMKVWKMEGTNKVSFGGRKPVTFTVLIARDEGIANIKTENGLWITTTDFMDNDDALAFVYGKKLCKKPYVHFQKWTKKELHETVTIL